MQLQIKLFFLFFFVILVSEFVFAGELGVSPARLEFNLKNKETVCREVKVFSGVKSELKIDNYWSLENSRNIEDYLNSSEDYGLEIYIEDFRDFEDDKVNVCVRAKLEGIYYGVLLFSYPNRKVGVGVWMVVKSGNWQILSLNWLDIQKDSGILEIVLMEMVLINASILFLLFIYSRNKKYREV